MCVLSDDSLRELFPQIFLRESEREYSHINPASIDIRIGTSLQFEDDSKYDLLRHGPYKLQPKEFVLVSTYEHITIPSGYAAHLFLKSTRARQGFDHSLAFWIDPGWSGYLTMEVVNNNRLKSLELQCGARFAQLIIEQLDKPATPYKGRYQGATSVETAKLEPEAAATAQ